MKTLTLALLSLVLCSSGVLAQIAEPPQIIVTGDGIIKAVPDQALISIGAESRSKISKEAQQRNAEAMMAVQQKIGTFGIPKEAIKTTAIELQIEFDYANGRQADPSWVCRAQHD